jgi:LysM repeat protein
MAANGIRSANRIRVGQLLEIPGRTRVVVAAAPSPREPAVPATPEPTASAATSYRVRSGDTLGKIARHHGVSERALAAHNGIKDMRLVKVGQELEIPGGAGSSRASSDAERDGVYTVRRGDTLDSIARRHGTTPKSLAALNGLRSAHRIKAGQRLVLPGQ